MDALLHRLHHFILVLMRGEDGVCACTCGRDQVYHVIPYNEVQAMEPPREGSIMTQQEKNMLVGLVSGLCISWFLMRLDRVWLSGLKYCRATRMNGVGFWLRFPKFSINMREFFRRLYPRHTQDYRGNMGHTKQEVYHIVDDSVEKM